jgi:hypothetical protein
VRNISSREVFGSSKGSKALNKNKSTKESQPSSKIPVLSKCG